jgi:hypothetical protein
MDERDLALANAAYFWSYNILSLLLLSGGIAYVIAGQFAPKGLAETMPLILLDSLPFLAFVLPDTMTLWLEPDWLDDSDE